MILIYASSSTKRLQYICKFIFAEVLGIAYSITIDKDSFISHKGEKITYCDHAIDDSFHIQQQQLLFEKDIREQSINCFEINGYKAFYKTSAGDYPLPKVDGNHNPLIPISGFCRRHTYHWFVE